MWLKLIVLIIAITLAITQAIILLSPFANAVGGVGDIVFDPQNYSSNIMTAARTLKSNLNEAMQLANQTQQLANEARNLIMYPVSYWQRVQANFEQLRALSQSNANIGQYLSQVNNQFSTLYPGYSPVENFGNAYKTWTDNALKAASKIMGTAEQQKKLFDSTTDRTQGIVADSAAGVGVVQQVQSQVALSSQMVGELQKLQQLQSEQATLQAAYIAGQVQDKASERKAVEDWLKRDSKPFL